MPVRKIGLVGRRQEPDFLQRTGAGPVEARIISRGFNISWRGGPPFDLELPRASRR
jgi:hypothetical protein